MGADLLLYAVPLVPEPKWDAGVARIAHICALDPGLAEEDGVAVAHGYEALDLAGMDADEPAECETRLNMDLSELKLVIAEDGDTRRDVVVLTLRGHEYLFTGGMSAGDSPTDFAEIVNRLSWTGVLEACGFTEAATNAVTLRISP